MKLKSYKEVIGMSKEKLDAALAPIRARQAKSKADMEMHKIDEDILNLETSVHEKCTEKDINFSSIIETVNKIAILEHKKKQYKKILTDLFPED